MRKNLSHAYYLSTDPENAGRDRKLMRMTSVQIKRNMKHISSNGIRLSPGKMNLLLYCPSAVAAVILGMVFDRILRLHGRFHRPTLPLRR